MNSPPEKVASAELNKILPDGDARGNMIANLAEAKPGSKTSGGAGGATC